VIWKILLDTIIPIQTVYPSRQFTSPALFAAGTSFTTQGPSHTTDIFQWQIINLRKKNETNLHTHVCAIHFGVRPAENGAQKQRSFRSNNFWACSMKIFYSATLHFGYASNFVANTCLKLFIISCFGHINAAFQVTPQKSNKAQRSQVNEVVMPYLPRQKWATQEKFDVRDWYFLPSCAI